ncbi:MAG: hypothetical protein EPO12_18295 [Aquabacterium sp.]|nr:MAG: hypothetical protein EPO12_18295 [Aquabacterium sp.]
MSTNQSVNAAQPALDHYDSLTAALETLQGLAAVLPALPPIPDHPACMLEGLGHAMLGLIRQALSDARELLGAEGGSHASA